jgi:sugar (pentulose or hexulose) kinase
VSRLLLGIDIGTSVVKAALFDESGREIVTAACRMATLPSLPDWSEAEPDLLWAATCTVIGQVLRTEGVAARTVAAVGISGAMVGAWIIDGAGDALRPGIFWNDGRTQPMIDAMIADDPRFMSRIFAVSGCVMQQGCTLPLLRWLSLHEPTVLARARAVFGAKDYIRWRLTGAIATDVTEAAVAPGSATDRSRSAALISLFGLDAFAPLLPPPSLCESLAGSITQAAARATGLLAGTPVAIGAGDVACSVIGAGGLTAGAACSILGTTCLNGIVMPQPIFVPPDLGLLFTLPEGLWLRTMVNVAGTTNIDWVLAALCPDLAAVAHPYEALAALAEQSPQGAEGAIYIPYLSEVGIIAPVVSPGARGGFAGLTPRHRRPDLLRAVYEGVAFAIRDCFATIGQDFGVVRLVGGGARSAFWRQVIADVLGHVVEVPAGTEFGAKGAALLAGVAVGIFPSVVAASEGCCDILHRHLPGGGASYDEAYRRYRTYAEALIPHLPVLS